MKKLALSCLGLLAGPAFALCYTVYDRDNRIVYQAPTPPVDMSRPLHETLPRAFPGGHLVFDNVSACPADNITGRPSPLAQAAVQGRTPLLTDRRTAQALGLPYTPVTANVVLVPQRPDSMRPGFTVVESEAAATAAAPTVPTPVQAATTNQVVITELYDPPITGVQDGRTLRVMGNR